MITVEYSSNNSGGSWWLKDEDWLKLEQAGWKIDWYRSKVVLGEKRERFLGALADGASKQFTTAKEALEEFERITGQNVTDEGCNCCGAPHSFSTMDENGKREYLGSGESLLSCLYPDRKVPSSLREAMEESA